jgi:hypothetical protein
MPKSAKKPPSKKKTAKPTKVSWWRKPPVLIALVLVAIASLVFANYVYGNWSNKQLILGISEDFPELIAEIEQATGLELEIFSDCMQTTEKFTEGVKLCGITAGLGSSDTTNSELKAMVEEVENNSNFTKKSSYRDGAGYNFAYQNFELCTINYLERVYIDCLIAPRAANEQLALEKLNAEYLNARKDFFRSNL